MGEHVYLLHFYNPNGNAYHYLGHTKRHPEVRLKEHQAGTGCRYTGRLVQSLGMSPVIAHLFEGASRTFETRLKALSRNNKAYQFKNWCPKCAGRRIPPPDPYTVMNWKMYLRDPGLPRPAPVLPGINWGKTSG